MLKARIFFALIFVALLTASAVAGDTPHIETAAPAAASTREEVPRAVAVTPEQRHEFGSIVQGLVLQHDFVVKNEGNAELVIERIAPG